MPKTPVFPLGIPIDIESAIRFSAQAFDQHKLVYGHGTVDALGEASTRKPYRLTSSSGAVIL